MSEVCKKTIIELKDVSLEIPIFSSSDFNLKRKLIKSVTGGSFNNNKKKIVVKALDSINLTVKQGEKIALIGHNGSGKTSFIRLISGIYHPTKGYFKTFVSVYPMVERSFIVEQELTGVESAKAHYLMMNNSLKGFQDFLDDVVEFSGLGDFIYLPLKTYSEGMASRLMFAMLTYQYHECLALDEGLGTGDKAFYNKAQLRLNSFLNKSGSLFIASHSKELLRKFCRRGIVFSSGMLVFDGEVEEALKFYDKSNC
tara:strand:- start:2043 stop:2807 length:765 start_codon:yes stop_codon:yes gene_type:complete